jgi:hypothetical protein
MMHCFCLFVAFSFGAFFGVIICLMSQSIVAICECSLVYLVCMYV